MIDSPLTAKLKAMADAIDPQTDGVAILIVGDVQYESGITSTGDVLFDVERLATALWKAFRMGQLKPRDPDAREPAGAPYDADTIERLIADRDRLVKLVDEMIVERDRNSRNFEAMLGRG